MSGLPIIVSYYTAGTRYERLAEKLRASCDRLGLDHYISELPSTGKSWEANTHLKASVCRMSWADLGAPILWVDADAIIHQTPELLRDTTADFAIHKWKGQYFNSATVFFNQTLAAERLLDLWVDSCPEDLTVSDQVHLQHAWDRYGGFPDTLWLPRSYCQVFDAPLENGEEPVIEQFQASRAERLKHMVSA